MSDELEIAEPDDFFVTRDEDDNLQPVTQPLPGVEQAIRVVPMTMGDVNKYGGEEEIMAGNITNEELADILNDHWYDVRTREDYEITAEMIEEDMIGFSKEALLTAILRASGYDMKDALNRENIEMLNELDDPEGFLKMAQTAENRLD